MLTDFLVVHATIGRTWPERKGALRLLYSANLETIAKLSMGTLEGNGRMQEVRPTSTALELRLRRMLMSFIQAKRKSPASSMQKNALRVAACKVITAFSNPTIKALK